MKEKYKAVIIGCGNIAAHYDQPEHSDRILTHAHAYVNEPRVKLCAMADIDKKKADEASRIWGCMPYYDVREMLDEENADIISICVPDGLHKEMLDLCLEYKPKIVFCEKPLTTDISSAEEIVMKYANAGIPLAVDFMRRWDPEVQQLRDEISGVKYGRVINICGTYSKGILHNGSHLIDLLFYLFGEISTAIPLPGATDQYENDPTIDAFISFESGIKAHIMGADANNYTVFELDILFEKARIKFVDSGFFIIKFGLEENTLYPRFLKLKEEFRRDTGLKNALGIAVSDLINFIEGGKNLNCSGEDALYDQKICINIRDNL